MGLFSRQFDFYRLKKTYRVQIAGFCFAGLAAAIVVITLGAIKVQAALGIKPGTPIQLIPHGWMILGIGSVAMLLVIALCILLGMALNAVYLCVTGQLTYTAAWGAVFLSKYPPEWFKPEKHR